MAQGLSLKVLLQLEAKRFNQSIKSVQKGLVSLKNTITGLAATLAGGLGFSKFVNDIKDTAVKLSVAQQSLKNVSNSTAEYAQNLQFLKRISNDYGQDLITLTNSFAQFYAAAKVSRLELEELKDIYEALTRAAGAYHLSADQTNNMMIAVTQMFSKGKVTAEELRRQLGNTLPGAFNLMAKAAQAAGIITDGTTAELEDMMRKGKVLADDVLPAFAQQLNAVTQSADFDSLQSSINRFQNAWAEFVEAGGFENFYNKMVQLGTRILQKWADDFSGFKSTLIGILGGIAGIPLFKGLSKSFNSEIANMKTSLEASEKTYKDFAKATDAAREAVDKTYASYQKFRSGKTFNKYMNMNYGSATPAQQKKILEYSKQEVEWHNKLQASVDKYNRAFTKEKELFERGMIPAYKTLNKELSIFEKGWIGVKGILKSVGAMFKAAIPIAIFSAILTLVTKIAVKIGDAIKEEQRLKNLADDHVNSVEKVSDATEISVRKMRQLQKLATDTTQSDEKRKKAIDKLNKELGRSKGHYFDIKTSVDDINTAVEDWITNTKKLAKAYAAFSKIQELEERNITLQIKNQQLEPQAGETVKTPNWGYDIDDPTHQDPYIERNTAAALKAQAEIQKNNREIAQNTDAINRIGKIIEEEGLEDPFTGKNGSGGNGGGGGDNGSDADKFKGLNNPIVDALEKYKEQATALSNRLKNDTISLDDFNDEMKKLQNHTWETITAISGFENVLQDLENIAKNAKSPEEKEAAENAIQVVKANMMDVKTAYFKNRDDARDEQFNELINKLTTGRPQLGKRDEKFDYNKTGEQKFEEKAELYIKLNADWDLFVQNANTALSQLDFSNFTNDQLAVVKDLLADIAEQAAQAASNATDMQHALQYIQISKTLKDQMKEFDDAITGTITGVADGMDRLYRSVQSLGDAFGEDIKWEGFEKLMAIINFSIQMFQTLKGVIDAVKLAEEAYATAKQLSAAKVVAANQMEAATSSEAAAAAAGAASAKGAESVASVPYAGPFLAVAAAAAISAAILAAMAKFANGGIVGGSSYSGDKNIIRANSGEMILTKGQQGTLFNAIQSGNLGGGNVNFVIRGADLVGTLNNYTKRSKG